MPRLPLRCQRTLTALVLLHLGACTSWQVQPVTPAELVEAKHPGVVRVTRSDGTTLTLYDPVIRGDSLQGRMFSEKQSGAVGIALGEVRTVSTSHVSGGKTLGLVGLLVGTMLVVTAIDVAENGY